jgi:arylsulfatase A-like enzyme
MNKRCVILLVGLLSCRSEDRSAVDPDRRPFNIALIVLDACRPDKLGCYGFDRETSPSLDQLARDPDAVVFRRHYVQSTWTKPSTASLFTGLFLHQHGVSMNPKRLERHARSGRDRFATDTLDARHDTIAEHLHTLGFATFAVVKSSHLIARNGFAQGFREYAGEETVSASDQERVQLFLGMMRRAAEPFFGYLHLQACHHPYRPGERHPDYMQRYGFPYDEAGRQRAGLDFTRNAVKDSVRNGSVRLDAGDLRFLHLIYEAQLRHTDERFVHPLLDELRRQGAYDRTMIIVTADHGEELVEHEGFGHGHALWEEVIHVPLIVKFPRSMRPAALGSEVVVPTSSIDLLPSLLSLLGAPVPAHLLGSPILEGAVGRFALVEQPDERGRIKGWAIIEGVHKLIETPPDARLFDLAADPHERVDLAARQPDRVESLRAAARAFRVSAETPVQAPRIESDLGPEVVEQLRALGYLEPDHGRH